MRNGLSDFLKDSVFVWRMGIGSAPLYKHLRIVKFLFKTRLLKKSVPSCVIMGLTYKCQCSCVFCSVDNYRDNQLDPELSTEELKRVIDSIANLGAIKINFFGGEPLLRSDILELVSHASKRGLFVFIDTNSILLDKTLVVRLKKAGVSSILISLASTIDFIHDQLCGKKGTHRKVMEGIGLCLEEKIPCVISTIATRSSIRSRELTKIIDFAKKSNVTGVRILLPMLSGKWGQQNEELLTPSELDYVFKCIEPGFVYLESGFSSYNAKFGRRKCSATEKEIIYISPSGEVQMCYTVPTTFGNIRERKLDEIIENMWRHDSFKCIPRGVCVVNNETYRQTVAKEKQGKTIDCKSSC